MFDMCSPPPRLRHTSGCGLNSTNVPVKLYLFQRHNYREIPKQQTDRNTCSLQVCQSQFSLLIKQKKMTWLRARAHGTRRHAALVSCERARTHARDPGNGWQLLFTLITFHSTAANSSAALCVNSPVWSGRQRTGALSAPLWSTAGSLPRWSGPPEPGWASLWWEWSSFVQNFLHPFLPSAGCNGDVWARKTGCLRDSLDSLTRRAGGGKCVLCQRETAVTWVALEVSPLVLIRDFRGGTLFPNTLWPLLIGYRLLVLRRGGLQNIRRLSMRSYDYASKDRLFRSNPHSGAIWEGIEKQR